MTIIKELRIVLPITVEEYHIAQLYAVAEMSKEETSNTGDGIEVLINEPYEKEGEKGQYTHKVVHLNKKIPSFAQMFIPAGMLKIDEKAWNAFPNCRTEYSSDYFKEKFAFSITSVHLADNGTIENAHNLTPEELAKREVEILDIADMTGLKNIKDAEDPTKFVSKKTGRGPLKPDTYSTYNPVMTCYKLYRIDCKMFLGSKAETFLLNQSKTIIKDMHRKLFCWIDEWYGLTMRDIRALEDKTKEDLAKKLNEKQA